MSDHLDKPAAHPPVEVGPDDVTARPRHTGQRWFDLIMAVTAILISSVSLIVAIDHGRTERQLVQANSWPSIQENTNINDRVISISIVNDGIGPAKMESFEMFYQGKLVTNPTMLLRMCCDLPTDAHQLIGQYVGGFDIGNPNQQVLRAGDTIRVLVLQNDLPPRHLIQKLAQHLSDISFRGCYCSVFDECWTGNLNSLETQRVKSCPADPDAFMVSVP
jgi:hypothetical protein